LARADFGERAVLALIQIDLKSLLIGAEEGVPCVPTMMQAAQNASRFSPRRPRARDADHGFVQPHLQAPGFGLDEWDAGEAVDTS